MVFTRVTSSEIWVFKTYCLGLEARGRIRVDQSKESEDQDAFRLVVAGEASTAPTWITGILLCR